MKNKPNIKSYVCFGLIVLCSLMPLKALAIDDGFYSSNDILFYNPDDCNSSGSGVGSSGTPSNSSMPYELPAISGKAGYEEAINSSGKIPSGGKVTFDKHAALGEAYQKFYITMRWNYVSWDWNGGSHDANNKQYNWFADKPRIVLVTNKRTGKSINAVALEAGPAPWTGIDRSSNNDPKQGWKNPQRGTPSAYTGRVAGFPPTAVDALKMKQGMYNGSGDVLTYEWAPDQSVTPGPTAGSASSNSNGCGSSSAAGEHGWDLTGEHAMVFYNECDSEWARVNFAGGSICQHGCGPDSLAMIVATLTGDKTVTPAVMAPWYESHGGASGGQSSWNWSVISQKWTNLAVTDLGTNMTKAKAVLDRGGLVLFSWTGAPFTGGGHIMVMRKYDPSGKIYIASGGGQINKKQSGQAWDESIFTNGYNGPSVDGRSGPGYLKGLWGFEKK